MDYVLDCYGYAFYRNDCGLYYGKNNALNYWS